MKRIAALDGLRGILALIVVLDHAAGMSAAADAGGLARRVLVTLLSNLGGLAVIAFFAMSAHVLTRAWDGNFRTFLARRAIRLWPVYALCLAAGYALSRQTPRWLEFAWYPVASSLSDPPSWSLCVEAWAMLFMPIIVWCGTGARWRLAAGTAAWLGLTLLDIKFVMGGCFLLGAALSRFQPRFAPLESAGAQWLGKISYSLYLSHWLVLSAANMAFGPTAAIPAIPAALLAGWAIWWAVERPSIALSRRVGRRVGLGLPPAQIVPRQSIFVMAGNARTTL